MLAPGWWPGGLIPYLKGCWIPIPGRPAGRGRGRFFQQFGGQLIFTFLLFHNPLSSSLTFQKHRSLGHERTRAAWPQTAPPAGPRCPSVTVLAAALRRALQAYLAGRGVVVEAPRACLGHRPFGRCGAALLSPPITNKGKTRREGANRPEGSCMRLAPLQAVAQRTGRKEQEQLKLEQEITGPGAGRPVGVPQSLKRLHSPTHPSYPCWPCRAIKTPAWGPPRRRLTLPTRPAADAAPWGRAARALPACKRGRVREGFGAGAAAGGEERRQCRGEGPLGRAQGRLRGGLRQERGGGHVWAPVWAR